MVYHSLFHLQTQYCKPDLKDAAKIQNNFGEKLCAVPNKNLVKDKLTGMCTVKDFFK